MTGLGQMIKVLFFAQLAEYAELDSLEVTYSPGLTPRTLVESLVGKLPVRLTDALIHDTAMVSANKLMISWDDPLNENDEVAFLPPFSGG